MSGKRWLPAYLELTGEFLNLATTHLNLVRDYADFKDEHRALEAAHDNLAAELAKRDAPPVVTDEMVRAGVMAAYGVITNERWYEDSCSDVRKAITAALEAGRS